MALHHTIIAYGRMTKKFLMSLEDGNFIASNVYLPTPGKSIPRLREEVYPLETREEQWKNITKANLSGRHFCVFKNKETYRQYLKEDTLGQQTKEL